MVLTKEERIELLKKARQAKADKAKGLKEPKVEVPVVKPQPIPEPEPTPEPECKVKQAKKLKKPTKVLEHELPPDEVVENVQKLCKIPAPKNEKNHYKGD